MKTTSSCFLVLLFISVFLISLDNFTRVSSYELIANPHEMPINLRTNDLPDILRCAGSSLYNQPYGEFDPLNEIVQIPLSLVYEPLVEFDEQIGEIIPVLAYQWVVTNDSKQWTFYLRDDVKFHDGSRFNASSVLFSIERAAQIEVRNVPFGFVEVVNEFQVTVHFTDSYAPFALREAQLLMIISPNSFEESNLTTPIGTGPYRFDVEQSNSSFLHFSRFDQYHEGLAPFKEIHYTLYFENDTEKLNNDLLSHTLHYTTVGDLFSNADPYWIPSVVFTRPIMVLGWFNHSNPYLANTNVRRAINYGLNRTALFSERSNFRRQPLLSVIPSGMFGHDSSVAGYPYNPELANSLLDQEEIFRDENNTRFSLIIVTPSRDFLSELSAYLWDLGIKCEFITENWQERIAMGNFDLIISHIVEFDPSFTEQLLHSNGSSNIGRYVNQAFDSLTVLARSTPVRQEREYYYNLIQSIAQEEAPYLLLNTQRYWYWQSQEAAPYFRLSGSYRFNFNYTHPVFFPKLAVYTDIEVQNQSLYFPRGDVIINNPNTFSLNVSLKMSPDLNDFLPTSQISGKFFMVEVDAFDSPFYFRCYYDFSEFEGLSPSDLRVFQYKEEENSWKEVPILFSNSSLRYFEVELQGDYTLLRLGETLIHVTYHFLPFVSLITLIIVLLISLTLFNNQQMAKYVKRAYK